MARSNCRRKLACWFYTSTLHADCSRRKPCVHDSHAENTARRTAVAGNRTSLRQNSGHRFCTPKTASRRRYSTSKLHAEMVSRLNLHTNLPWHSNTRIRFNPSADDHSAAANFD